MNDEKTESTHTPTPSHTPPTPPPKHEHVAPAKVAKPVKKDNSWKRAFFVLSIVALSLFSVGIGAGASWWYEESKTTSYIAADSDGNELVTETELSVASVVEAVTPSVVSIVTSTQVNSFYGSVDQEGAGTGIIVSADGYIMTNNHVIDGASTVSVVTSDGTLYEDVTIIGRDPLNDVAFLKIESSDTFQPATIGDSSTVRVGQQVVAIGNALGQYSNTVTSGILSGTNRPVTASTGSGEYESLTDLLQTDASINSGNSGGPLLNLAGQVIGINTAVASDAQGIGFAIPIDSTKGILAEVLETGEVSRAYIGINYLDITGEIAREYDLEVTSGAYIYAESGSPIVSGSPADDAGLESGDIITQIDEYVVGEDGGLSSIIGRYRPDDTITLTVLRDSETLTIEVTLDSYSS